MEEQLIVSASSFCGPHETDVVVAVATSQILQSSEEAYDNMVCHFIDRESMLQEQIEKDALIIKRLLRENYEVQFESKRLTSVICLMKKNSGDSYRRELDLKREIQNLKSNIAADAIMIKKVVSGC